MTTGGRICFECDAPAEHMHHVIPKSLGGKRTIPLCVPCHRAIHSAGQQLSLGRLRMTAAQKRVESPRKPIWSFRARRSGIERTSTLSLYWEVEGDPISGWFDPSEDHAVGVLRQWWREQNKPVTATINWYVRGSAVFECAPGHGTIRDEDFLTFFTWPVDAETGDPVAWTALPVDDKLWSRGDKGGFIQSALFWKPAPFQATIEVQKIASLAGVRL